MLNPEKLEVMLKIQIKKSRFMIYCAWRIFFFSTATW